MRLLFSFLLCTSLLSANEWILDANGDWNVDVNWNPASFPNSAASSAEFLGAILGNRTITLGQDITVGTMQFDDNNRYTIVGANTLTFDSLPGTSTIEIFNGQHTIEANMSLTSTLIIDNQVLNPNKPFSLEGDISGSGALIKEGFGTLALGRPNTTNSYTGGTIINQGIVEYYRLGVPPGSLVTINDGQMRFRDSMSDSHAFSVDVKAAGLLAQGNNGKLVRLNEITGDGEVRISALVPQGFEVVGGPSTFNGTVTLGREQNTEFSPDAGSRIRLRSNAEWTLTGSNTFVCRVYVKEDSSIYVQNSQALGRDLANGGGRAFTYEDGSYVFNPPSGNLTFTKTFFLNGVGAFSRGSIHNMLGDNEIQSDTQIGWSGGSVVPEDVTICVEPGTSLTFSGALTGAQNLTYICGGDVVYSGSSPNTLTGQTSVSAGRLLLQKSAGVAATSGPTVVQSNGHLVGSGLLGGTTTVHGTFEPETSTSQIDITGDLILEPGSKYVAHLTPTQSSLTSVTGNVTIGPSTTLDLRPLAGTYPPSASWTLITAPSGTITGQFGTVLVSGATFPHQVIYNNGSIQLLFGGKLLEFCCCCPNAIAIGCCLNEFITTGTATEDLTSIIDVLYTLDKTQLCCALDQMQPSQVKAYIITQEENAIRQRNKIDHRLAYWYKGSCYINHTFPQEMTIWVEGMGDYQWQQAQQQNVGFNAWSADALLGLDVAPVPTWLVGAAIGYTYSKVHWEQCRGNGNIHSGYGSLYSSYYLPNTVFSNIILSGAYNHYDGVRNIRFATVSRGAMSSYGGAQALGHIEVGGILNREFSQFRPYACFDYVYSHQQEFCEDCADSLNTCVCATNNNLFRSEAGIYLAFCMYEFSLQVKLGYVNETRLYDDCLSATLACDECCFNVTTMSPQRNFAAPSIAATLEGPESNFSLSFWVDAEVCSSYYSADGSLQILYRF